MRLTVIASGSSGNAAVIRHNNAAVLIDCGVTLKTLKAGLDAQGMTLDDIKAVFFTHSHGDHVSGLPALRRATDAPFYSAVPLDGCELADSRTAAGMEITAFACSHDVPCVGYKLRADGHAVCVATDTGVVTEQMRAACHGCESVVIECNHDTELLRTGPYSAALKRRIASPRGHLSNADCAAFVLELANDGLRQAVLAHLSEHNNTPLLAKSAVWRSLSRYGLENDVGITVAEPGLSMELQVKK